MAYRVNIIKVQNIGPIITKYIKISGAYGTVLKARNRDNPNSIVALKKFAVPLTENGIPNNAIREIGLLKQLCSFNHPNIVK